jgi:adenosylmethionine-8-amino-7-oxononanoate aminotransferase
MSSLSERDICAIWHPFTQALISDPPIGIVRGKGSLLYTEEGKELVDAISSWWVNIHGHANPYIAQRISTQLATLEHVMFGGFTHEPAVRLAEELLKLLPNNQDKIFYSDNGSTATEVALKMAIQFWANQGIKKRQIIALKGSYHGDTFGAMAMSERGIFTLAFHDLLLPVIFIDLEQEEKKVLSDFEDAIKSDTAAFIFEPIIQGVAGMRISNPSLVDKLIRTAKKSRIITIADEVMTGFYRTGKTFASDYLQEKPDIICLSKSLTGGFLPLGVTSCSQYIYEAFLSRDRRQTFFHGHSYTANPLACTAACATLELLQKKECLDNIARIESMHKTFLDEIADYPKCHLPRQLGTICAFNFDTDKFDYTCEAHQKLYKFYLNRGILLRPLGAVVYVMPPYSTTTEQLERIYSVIKESLTL